MRFRSPVTDRVVESTKLSFFDFIAKRLARFPTVLERMAADPFAASWWLRPFGWISFKRSRVKKRRFIFLSNRFPELVGALANDDAAVIGSVAELRRARELGIKFCLNADLYLAAHAILFGTRGIPVERIIQRWITFFGQQADPCYLVLAHDTSPISLLLTMISAECSNMRSVCIQHGLFNAGSDHDDIEGRNSDFNLVYHGSQKAEMLRRLPGACVEVMGFPAEIPVAKLDAATGPDVILVGTGFTDQSLLLEKSLAIFRKVAELLREAVGRIEYRPHPSEQLASHLGSLEFSVNVEPKEVILSGARKLFIGFNSTLLYEASLSGHLVVVLDDEQLPGYRIQPIGVTVNCRKIADLRDVISQEWKRHSVSELRASTLRDRLTEALQRLEGSPGSRGSLSQ